MVLGAHLSKAVPSDQPLHVLMDGVFLSSQLSASGAFLDRVGLVLYSATFPLGVHTFLIEDAGGNELAQGTVHQLVNLRCPALDAGWNTIAA